MSSDFADCLFEVSVYQICDEKGGGLMTTHPSSQSRCVLQTEAAAI